MRIVLTHNNAYDSMLLIDGDHKIVSAWTQITTDDLVSFGECWKGMSDWDIQNSDGLMNVCRPMIVQDYGPVYASAEEGAEEISITDMDVFLARMDFFGFNPNRILSGCQTGLEIEVPSCE